MDHHLDLVLRATGGRLQIRECDAARLIAVSQKTLVNRRLAGREVLATFVLGRRRYVRAEEIARFLGAGSVITPAPAPAALSVQQRGPGRPTKLDRAERGTASARQ